MVEAEHLEARVTLDDWIFAGAMSLIAGVIVLLLCLAANGWPNTWRRG